jgi:hypothetical protein
MSAESAKSAAEPATPGDGLDDEHRGVDPEY